MLELECTSFEGGMQPEVERQRKNDNIQNDRQVDVQNNWYDHQGRKRL